MRKLVESKEHRKRIIKRNEQGSVTLFVLIAMLFFLTVGIAVYISNMNIAASQQRDVKKIQNEYNHTGDVEQIYEEQKDKLSQKLLIVVKDSEGNIYQDSTWTNKAPLTVEVNWPDGLRDSERKIMLDGITIDKDKIEELSISESCTLSAKVNGENYSINIKVDTTAPNIQFNPNGKVYIIGEDGKANINTQVTATDNESGVKSVKYAWVDSNGGLPDESEWKEIEGVIQKEVSTSGTYYLCVKAIDNVGNQTIQWSKPFKAITIQEAEESITITQEPEDWTNKDVHVTIDYGELLTAVRRVGFGKTEAEANQAAQNNSLQTENPIDVIVTENGFVYVQAQNTTYGIQASKIHNVTNIDKDNPIIDSKELTPVGFTKEDVTITIKSTDSLSGIVGWQVSKQDNLTAQSQGWNAIERTTDQITTTQEIQENGTYYIYVKDAAGNVTKDEIEINNIDKNGPELNITGNPENWTKEDVTLEITATDNETGIKSVTVNGTPIEITDGKGEYIVTENGTYEIIATDEAGNTTTQIVVVDKIDKNGPELNVTGNPENWTKEDVTLEITATDSETGIKSVTVNGTPIEITDGTGNYTVTENGEYVFIATDEAGNTTTKTVVVDKIDKEKPTNKVPTAISTSNTITVTFTQTDRLSGIDDSTIQYAIRKKGELEWTIVNDSEKVHTFTGLEKDTTYEVKTVAQDNAGNETESEILEVKTMNLIAPVITHTPLSMTNEDVTVTISAPDLSEGLVVKYGTDGETFKELPSNPYTFTVNKNQTIYAIIEDTNGQKSDITTYEIANIDKLLPIVNSITANTASTNQGVTITATAKDAIATQENACSGIVQYMFSKETNITALSDGWTTIDLTKEEIIETKEVTENETWYFYVKDAAGNVNVAGESNKIVIGNIDKLLPTISVLPESNSVNKTTNITIALNDEGGSGLNSNTQYQYKLGTSETQVPTGDFKTYENNKTFEVGTNLTGTYYLWVKEVQDNAGNTSEENGTKIDAYHVFGPYVFDNSAPNVEFNPNTNTTYAKTQSSKVTVEDEGTAGVNTTSLKYKWVLEGASEPAEDSFTNTFVNGANINSDENLTGKYHLWVLAEDNLRNKQKVRSDVFYFDNTEPTTIAPVKKVATSSTITVEFKQTDLHSGIDTSSISYGIKGPEDSDWTWTTDSNTTHKFTGLSKETTYQIRTKVTDNAGNGETLSEIVEITTGQLDIPVISISPETSTNDKVTVTVTYPEIDGVKYEYSEDGENWTEVQLTDGEYSKDITENKTIYARIKDENGQTSEVATLTIGNIDKLEPTVTITPNGGSYVLNPGETSITEQVTITARDTGTSGLDKLQYAVSTSNSEEPTTWIDFTNGSTNEITLQGGENYIWLNVTDLAGNKSKTTISNVFKVDYKIEYDANGGENAPQAQVKTHLVDLTVSNEEGKPSWNGHAFKGWATSYNSGIVEYKPGDVYKENKSITLYAVWDVNSYTVNFDAMGGTVDTQNKSVTYGVEYGALPTPTKQGYKFAGWYLENNYINKVEETTIVTATSNHTLYAQWLGADDISYTIYHYLENANDNGFTLYRTETRTDGKTNEEAILANKAIGIDNSTYSYASLTDGGETAEKLTINADGTSKAYLYYTRNTFTLSLSKNSNINSVTGQGTYKWGQDVTINATLGAEEGYKYSWSNWTNVQDGTEYSKEQETTITMPTNNLELTANATKTPNKYTVTYDYSTNGGTTAQVTTAQVDYTSNIDLSVTATKSNYTFVGWNTDKNATVGLSTITMPKNDITIYAIFKKTVTVTFIDYSGTIKTSRTDTQDIYNNNTGTIVVPEQNIYTGWTKNGWTTSRSNTATAEVEPNGGDITDITSNVTYYGLYTKDVKVTYNLNGVTGTVPETQTGIRKTNSYAIASISNPNVTISNIEVTKPGYTFSKWNTVNNGTGTDYTVGQNVTLTESLNLYAIWTANTYTITLNPGEGATITTPEGEKLPTLEKEVTYDENYGDLPEAEKPGYIFDGWYTEDDQEITEDSEVKISEDQELHAKWSIITYNISYELNGGTTTLENPTTYTVETENFTLNNPTKPGYTFTGWTGSNGDTANTTVTIEKGSIEDKTYTANYTANKYTVDFETNGGILVDSIEVTYDEPYGALEMSSKPGYTFEGWYLEPNFVTKVENTTIVKTSSNHTLYANWVDGENTQYKVEHYKQNIDDNKYTLFETESKTGKTNSLITPDVKTYEGFTSPTVTTTSIQADGSTIVKYLYKRNEYTVTFESNGGTQVENKTVKYEKEITLDSITKSGYNFGGWYKEPEFTNKVGNTYKVIDNTTLYAKWDIITYNITYDLNGGSLTQENPTTYTVETENFTLNNPSKEGYTFTGWTGSNGTTPNTTVAITKGTTGDKTYTANYNVNNYTVTFNPEGGTVTPESKIVTYNENYGELPTPSKTGYTFGGWYIGQSETKELVTSTSIVKTASDHTLYAKWIVNNYTITYNANGGTGAPGSQTKEYNKNLVLSNTKPTRTGYTFKGWGLSSGTTTVTYNPSDTLLANTIANDLVLYAVWEINSYTLSYNANGGTVNNESTTAKYDETVTMPTPIREYKVAFKSNGGNNVEDKNVSYTFNGWYTSKTGGTKRAYTKMPAYNETLYAQWTESGTILPNSNKTGYILDGWYDENGQKQGNAGDTYIPTENVTLEAHWLANDVNYTVYHYLENANDNNYTLYGQARVLKAKADSIITLEDLKTTISNTTYVGGNITGEETGVGTSITTTTILPDGSRNVYLYYTRNTYKLTLNKNEYISTVNGSGTYKWGANVEIKATVGTKTGYDLLWVEWISDNTSLLANQEEKDTIITMPSGDITLIATGKQTAKQYEITFDPSGGSITNNTKEAIYDQAYGTLPEVGGREGLTAKTYTLTYKYNYDGKDDSTLIKDCRLEGWYKESNYTNKVESATIVTTANSHTLYAKWNNPSITLEIPTRVGYKFAGWYEDIDCQSQAGLGGSEYTITKNTTLYAKWVPDGTAYTVIHQKMNLDGTTYETAETEILTGTTDSEVTPAVKSYEGFTAPVTQTITINGDGTSTVIYKYTRNKYAYVLGTNENATTTGSTQSNELVFYGETIILKGNADVGYTWSKWTSSNTELQSDIVTADTTFAMPAGNLTMTPEVVENTYTIAFDSNGGSGTMESITGVKYTQEQVLPESTFVRSGYVFIGWAISESGDKVHNNKDTVSKLSSTNGETVTLYAVWMGATNPGDVAIKEGTRAIFRVTGTNVSSYQWYKNTENSNSNGTPIEGATNPIYAITGSNLTRDLDNTYYYCIVNNGEKSYTTEAAKLTVYYPFTIVKQPSDEGTVLWPENEMIQFSVICVGGNPNTYTYQWYKNTSNSNSGGTAIEGKTGSDYQIPSVTQDSYNNYYYCEISNGQYTIASDTVKIEKAIYKITTNSNNTYTTSWKDAVEQCAINGSTITLLSDYTDEYNSAIPISQKNIVFNTNGKKLKIIGFDIYVENNATLEINGSGTIDGKIENYGELDVNSVNIYYTGSSNNYTTLLNEGEAFIVNSSIDGDTAICNKNYLDIDNSGIYGISYGINNYSEIYISTTCVESSGGYYGIFNQPDNICNVEIYDSEIYTENSIAGICTYTGHTAILENTNIDSNTGSAILNYGANIDIRGGIITSQSAADIGTITNSQGTINITGTDISNTDLGNGIKNVNAGNVTINTGSNITAENNYSIFNSSSESTLIINGGTISATTDSSIFNEGKLNISGGTIINTSDQAAICTNANSHINITGGTIINSGNGIGLENNGQVIMTGGIIRAYNDVAVYGNGTFTLGDINKEVNDLDTIISNGPIIYGNYAKDSSTASTNLSYIGEAKDTFNFYNGALAANYHGYPYETSGTINIREVYEAEANSIDGSARPVYTYLVEEKNYEIRTDGNLVGYARTLEQAVSKATAEGTSTITLLKDLTDTSSASIGKNIDFNLNNHNLSRTSAINVNTAGNLTIRDGTIQSTAYVIRNYGTVDVNGLTIDSQGAFAIYNYDGTVSISDSNIKYNSSGIVNVGTLNINSGATISNTSASTNKAISNSGTLNINSGATISSTSINVIDNSGTLNMTGGTVEHYGEYTNAIGSAAIFNYGNGTMLMTGGKVISDNTYAISNINGGTFTLGDINKEVQSVEEAEENGPFIYGYKAGTTSTASSHKAYMSDPDATFNFYNGVLAANYTSTPYTTDGTVNIRKGYETNTYSSSSGVPVYMYLISDYKYEVSVDGNVIGCTETLAEAIGILDNNNVPSSYNPNNIIIKVLKDVTDEEPVTIGYNLTLDTNGKTITRGNNSINISSNHYVFIKGTGSIVTSSSVSTPIISNSGTLTLNDSTISGRLVNSGIPGIYNNGCMNINSGTISIEEGTGVYNEGALNISGGTVTTSGSGITISNTRILNITGGNITNTGTGIGINNNGQVTMTGGTINASNYYGVYSNGTFTLGDINKEVADIQTITSNGPIIYGNSAKGTSSASTNIAYSGGTNDTFNFYNGALASNFHSDLYSTTGTVNIRKGYETTGGGSGNPAYMFLTGNYEVSVDSNVIGCATTLAEAVKVLNDNHVPSSNNPNSVVIKVLRDVADTEAVTIARNLTVDTNGKTITKSNIISISGGGVLIKGNGTIRHSSSTNSPIITNAGALILSDVSLSAKMASTTFPGIRNTGSLTINSGTISSTGTGIYNSGSLYMYGGTISTTAGYGIQNSGGQVIMTGGIINSKNNYGVYGNGTFTLGNNRKDVQTYSDAEKNGPFIYGNSAKDTGTASTNIAYYGTANDTFNFYNGALAANYNSNAYSTSGTLNIRNGCQAENYTNDGNPIYMYLVEEHNYKVEVNGHFISYAGTLESAVNKASTTESSTITLLKDLTDTSSVSIGKNIVLDLNSYKLSNTNTINITQQGRLNLTNGDILNSTSVAISNSGTLNISTGVTILTDSNENTYAAIVNNKNAIIDMSGGLVELEGKDDTRTNTEKAAIYNNGGILYITGGKVFGDYAPAVTNLNDGTVTLGDISKNVESYFTTAEPDELEQVIFGYYRYAPSHDNINDKSVGYIGTNGTTLNFYNGAIGSGFNYPSYSTEGIVNVRDGYEIGVNVVDTSSANIYQFLTKK